MTELLTEFDPPSQYLSQLAASLVGSGADGGRSLAFWVLGPPSNENAVFVADLFGGRPSKRGVEPALEGQLSRSLCHVRTVATGSRMGTASNGLVEGYFTPSLALRTFLYTV